MVSGSVTVWNSIRRWWDRERVRRRWTSPARVSLPSNRSWFLAMTVAVVIDRRRLLRCGDRQLRQWHPNLVQLIGCCVEDGNRILVYDYLKNNSLATAMLSTLIPFLPSF
ncbi:hypothetical protein L1987_20638 [Smallanthus sonchifolius]|uniref:Uncharacterized protein n=1 Tax=Smallanthus sonchifolius TaxID=185202 RepID=A0ACB9IS78_9ASTR|nr:hypothetical protein L1987_20638 [Smallanthus sonchifolius]